MDSAEVTHGWLIHLETQLIISPETPDLCLVSMSIKSKQLDTVLDFPIQTVSYFASFKKCTFLCKATKTYRHIVQKYTKAWFGT